MIELRVTISGRDVSPTIRPALLSLSVTDGTEAEADEAVIVLADEEGRAVLPDPDADVAIHVGHPGEAPVLLFRGVIDECRSSGGEQGRQLEIACTSVSLNGPAKQPGEKFWDDTDLPTILRDVFEGTGIEIRVDPTFASIVREFESMDGRDPLTYAADLAAEIGATFKTFGKVAVFARRNDGTALTGEALPVFTVAWGDNLLEWDIAPRIPRARFGRHRARYFDRAAGEWKVRETAATGGLEHTRSAPAPSEEIAASRAEAGQEASDRERADGTITCLGDARAQAGGKVRLTGARPGVDGLYTIATVTHEIDAGEGWTMDLEIRTPGEGAGEDTR